jgi:hypothetical protein
MKGFTFIIGFGFCSWVSALPTNTAALGVHFENNNPESPLLKLDYATYRGRYLNETDVSYALLRRFV